MEIKVGGKYRIRNGQGPFEVKYIKQNHHYPACIYWVEVEDAKYSYDINGSYMPGSGECGVDLVAEWVEPEATKPEPQPVSNATMVGEAAPANDNGEQPESEAAEALNLANFSVSLEVNARTAHSIRAVACELILMGEDAAGCLLIKREAELEKRLAKAA